MATPTPENPRGYDEIANGERDLPRATTRTIRQISIDVAAFVASLVTLATGTTPGLVRLARNPSNPDDPVAANAVVTQNQVLLFVCTNSSVTLLGRKWQGEIGTNQTFSNADNITTTRTKVAALYGASVSTANFTVTAVVPKYVVAGLSGSAGDYVLTSNISSQQTVYALGGSRVLYFNGSTAKWNIAATLGGTALAQSAGTDPLGTWTNGVTITEGSGGFSGVAFRMEPIGIYATQNLPYLKAAPGATNYGIGISQVGSFGGDAMSRGSGKHQLDRIDDLEFEQDNYFNQPVPYTTYKSATKTWKVMVNDDGDVVTELIP